MSEMNNQNEELGMDEEIVESGAISKLVNIVIAPSKALKGIKVKPNLIIPMILVVLVPVIYYVAFWSSIELQMIRTIEAQLEVQGQEVTQELLDLSLGFAKWGTPVMVVITTLFGGLISGTYYFICAKMAESTLSFKQSMSIAYHVMVISLFSWILMMVLTLAGIDFIQEVPMTSLASLLPSSMNTTFLYGLALPIEVFSIWGSVVTYFALRIVAEMSKKTAMISVIVAFLIGMFMSGGWYILASLLNTMG